MLKIGSHARNREREKERESNSEIQVTFENYNCDIILKCLWMRELIKIASLFLFIQFKFFFEHELNDKINGQNMNSRGTNVFYCICPIMCKCLNLCLCMNCRKLLFIILIDARKHSSALYGSFSIFLSFSLAFDWNALFSLDNSKNRLINPFIEWLHQTLHTISRRPYIVVQMKCNGKFYYISVIGSHLIDSFFAP